MSDGDALHKARCDLAAQILEFRAISIRCWAQQDRRRPLVSLIRRMRARQATKFADRLTAMFRDMK